MRSRPGAGTIPRSSAVLACVWWSGASAIDAQERFEIDHDAGRVVVSNWEYGFREVASIDHQARLIFVVDAEEPLAAMAFSLVDGESRGTFGGAEGDGPNEIRELVAVAATAEGVLVASHTRVQRWRLDGSLADVWMPKVPVIGSVCSIGGKPGVPLHGGVAVQSQVRSDSVLGIGRLGSSPVGEDLDAVRDAAFRLSMSSMACFDDIAYVLDDQLTGFSLDGPIVETPIPPEMQEQSRRRQEAVQRGRIYPYAGLYHDGNGRLLVTMWAVSMPGALIDPETHCYSLLFDSKPGKASRRLVGIYGDSAVILESPPQAQSVQGRSRPVAYAGESSVIALRPLRPVGGGPCAAEGPA